MKKEAMPFTLEEKEFDGTKVLFSNLFSNGILYLNLMFDVRTVTEEELPYLGILKAVLGYVDTKTYTYDDLANEINLETGGMSSVISTYDNAKEEGAYEAKFEIRIKALYDKLPKAMTLLEEILLSSKLEDTKRLKEILSEVKSKLQMTLSASGNLVSAARAMSYFSETAKYSDLTLGIDFYRVVADYEEHFDEKKEELIQRLQKLVRLVFTKENLMAGITCDEAGFEKIPAAILELKEKLPKAGETRPAARLSCRKKNEGFMDASKVQYVSMAGNFRKAGFSYTGIMKILKVILSYDYLWLNVRVKGGAYGCGGSFMRNGNVYFSSYRDPNLEKTKEVYEGIPDYLRNFTADEREMTKYIIGTISELDTPMNPAAKGMRSVAAYLTGITYEDIQKERDEVIKAEPEDIREISRLVKEVLSQENFCVIGNEEKITEQSNLFASVAQLF